MGFSCINSCQVQKEMLKAESQARTSDFFQDWWAEVTHAANNGGSFSEMMGQAYQTKYS